MLPIVIGIGVAAILLAGCAGEDEPNSSSPSPTPLPPNPLPPPSQLPPPYRFHPSLSTPPLRSMALRLLAERVSVNRLDRGSALYFPWEENPEPSATGLYGTGDSEITDTEISFAIYRAGRSDGSSPNIQALYREMMGDSANRLSVAGQLMLAPQASDRDRAESGRLLENLLRENSEDTFYLRAFGNWHRLGGDRGEALRRYVIADENTLWLAGDSPAWGLIREMNESGESAAVGTILTELGAANHAYARHYLGRWHEDQGRSAEAVAAYERALALENENSENYVFLDTRRRLIDLLVKDERYAEAEAQFRLIDEVDLDDEDLSRREFVRKRLAGVAP